MRNLIEYPITKEEIALCIYQVIGQIKEDEEFCWGVDMTPLLLEEAIKHVRGSTLKLSDLGTVSDNSEGVGSG